MTQKHLDINYLEASPDEIPHELKPLVEKAKRATDGSYTPYSHFKVGCAIHLEDGTDTCGSNQENASYPCGCCAERTTLFYTQANHPGTPITDIVVAATTHGRFTPVPLPPCGLCRQALLEAEEKQGRNIRLTMYGTERVWIVPSISSLLPFKFDAETMEQ